MRSKNLRRINIVDFSLKNKAFKENKGFTLIELILYIAIVSIIFTALIPFAWEIISSSVKNSSQQEISSQARFISEKIKYEIRNANNINSVTSNSISLAVDPPNNPTIIDLSGGNIRITKGASGPYNLNSNDTQITSLTFSNYSTADNKSKHINFTFNISFDTGSTRQEYQVPDIAVESSAELRSN